MTGYINSTRYRIENFEDSPKSGLRIPVFSPRSRSDPSPAISPAFRYLNGEYVYPDEHLDEYVGGRRVFWERLRTNPSTFPLLQDGPHPPQPAILLRLIPFLPKNNSLSFEPVDLKLYNDGPSMKVMRSRRMSRDPVVVIGGGGSSSAVGTGRRTLGPPPRLPPPPVPGVSPGCHCQVWCEGMKVMIQDVGETSDGTWLNFKRLAQSPYSVSHPFQLTGGDVISLGTDPTDVNLDGLWLTQPVSGHGFCLSG